MEYKFHKYHKYNEYKNKFQKILNYQQFGGNEVCLLCYEDITDARLKFIFDPINKNCYHTIHIECYNNYMEVDNDSIEFQYFLQFDSDFPELKPYRTEWMVYYEELKLSGSIDMVYENPDGTLQIYDWKRVLELKTESFGGKCAKTDCISHLPDSNYWHYSLQLNTYKMILEHKYGKKVTGLYLVCLHPDNVYKKYERIEVKVMDKEMVDLYALRLEQVKNGTYQVKKH